MLSNHRKFKIAATAAAVATSVGMLTGFTDVTEPTGIIDTAWKYLKAGGVAALDSETPYFLPSGEGPSANQANWPGRPNHTDFHLGPDKSPSGTYAGGMSDIMKLLVDSAPANKILTPNFARRLPQTLPERKDIRSNPVFPSADDQSNIIMKPGMAAKVWATFVDEGAGFRNSVGYFIYDPANPPTKPSDVSASEIIAFPDASTPSPLPKAGKDTGATVYLGEIPAGKAMGFFIVSNGWVATNGRSQPFAPTISGRNRSGVKEAINKDWVYYSVGNLNPEPKDNRNLHRHAMLLKDGGVGSFSSGYLRMALGFEDYLRTSANCDHDFNDVVLAVHVVPTNGNTITDTLKNLNRIPSLLDETDTDSDGDGVKNQQDAFPTDATRTAVRYFPDSQAFGSLGFEDQWPTKGDYDFNDLMVKYRAEEILNANGLVKELNMTYRFDARGGKFHSGFAFRLDGINTDKIESITITDPNGFVTSLAPTLSSAAGSFSTSPTAPAVHPRYAAATTDPYSTVIRLFDDAYTWLPGVEDSSDICSRFYNTGLDCPILPSKTFEVKVIFKSPVVLPPPPYDPFIFRQDDSGMEVHLPGKQPTNWAKVTRVALFGSADDTSNLNAGRTYLSSNNLPWAMHLPFDWDYPRETINALVVYPDLLKWGNTSGVTDTDWYTRPSNINYTFRKNRQWPTQ